MNSPAIITSPGIPDYGYRDAKPTWPAHYLWPAVRSVVAGHKLPSSRAFELGCGNGAGSDMLSKLGFEVTGIDPSPTGIEIAQRHFSDCTFVRCSGYDDLSVKFGQFGLVMSLEVLQHCSYPRRIAANAFRLLEPGGIAIISTTYHGYCKNLLLALAGKLDRHFNPLWESGALKFFSVKTLRLLLLDAGFQRVDLQLVGRFPLVAKSMIAIAWKE